MACFVFYICAKPTNMKKITFIALSLVLFQGVFAQKIKGSKKVTVASREISDFETIEVSNAITLFLTAGDTTSLEVEADDNLHDVIAIHQSGNALHIYATQEIGNHRKFSVKITHTDSFSKLVAKGTSNVTALTPMNSPQMTMEISGHAKVFANIKSSDFTMALRDKARAEMNLSSETASVEMTENATLKALISSGVFKADLYQRANAVVEGDALHFTARMDNNSTLGGKNLTVKNADLTLDGGADCTLEVTEKAVISATGKTQLNLHGEQKLEVNLFSDNAVISKRSNKIK